MSHAPQPEGRPTGESVQQDIISLGFPHLALFVPRHLLCFLPDFTATGRLGVREILEFWNEIKQQFCLGKMPVDLFRDLNPGQLKELLTLTCSALRHWDKVVLHIDRDQRQHFKTLLLSFPETLTYCCRLSESWKQPPVKEADIKILTFAYTLFFSELYEATLDRNITPEKKDTLCSLYDSALAQLIISAGRATCSIRKDHEVSMQEICIYLRQEAKSFPDQELGLRNFIDESTRLIKDEERCCEHLRDLLGQFAAQLYNPLLTETIRALDASPQTALESAELLHALLKLELYLRPDRDEDAAVWGNITEAFCAAAQGKRLTLINDENRGVYRYENPKRFVFHTLSNLLGAKERSFVLCLDDETVQALHQWHVSRGSKLSPDDIKKRLVQFFTERGDDSEKTLASFLGSPLQREKEIQNIFAFLESLALRLRELSCPVYVLQGFLAASVGSLLRQHPQENFVMLCTEHLGFTCDEPFFADFAGLKIKNTEPGYSDEHFDAEKAIKSAVAHLARRADVGEGILNSCGLSGERIRAAFDDAEVKNQLRKRKQESSLQKLLHPAPDRLWGHFAFINSSWEDSLSPGNESDVRRRLPVSPAPLALT